MSKAANTRISIQLGQHMMVIRASTNLEDTRDAFLLASKQGGLAFIKVPGKDREALQIINTKSLVFIQLEELFGHEDVDPREPAIPKLEH